MKELLSKIKAKKQSMRTLINEKKLDEAEAIGKELEDLNRQYELMKVAYEDEQENVAIEEPAQKAKPDGFALIAKIMNGSATVKEIEEIIPSPLITGGENGEDYLIPVDVKHEINLLRRQYKSAKELVTVIPTKTLLGGELYEDSSNYSGLENFSDGDLIPEGPAPKFNPITWSLKQYGKLIPISNRLLTTEKGRLMSYINKWFIRNAIITENKKIFATLMKDKEAKPLSGWLDLKVSINIDLDPSLLIGGVIVTNQTGFNTLDDAVDENGRPILQPDPTDKTKMTFKGLPIDVFSNALLPDIEDDGTGDLFSPIFYGNLKEAANFYELEHLKFAASDHALFNKNQKALRLIEDIDCVQTDSSSYIYGLLPSAGEVIIPDPPQGT